MDVEREFERFSRFLPKQVLLERTSLALRVLPEPCTHVLPSIVLAPDGLALSLIMLVTDHYICDVKIGGKQQGAEFDIASKRSVGDYRIKVWTHEIKEGEAVKASYELAQVELIHTVPPALTTVLTYAGGERTEWLREVTDAIPVRLALAVG